MIESRLAKVARRWLVPHPLFEPPRGVKVRTDFSRRPEGYLGITFTVWAPAEVLVWHGEGAGGRTDELWRHGCLEVFIAGENDSYVEINLAPTRRWAAYAFDQYRERMRDAEVALVEMHWVPRTTLSIPRYEMSAVVQLPNEIQDSTWRLNITAVIEAATGAKSYWALAHAPGAPDFHNRDSFVAILPA